MTRTPDTRQQSTEPRRHTTVRLRDDRRLAYTEYGRRDGDPVVFFHGTPGSRRLGQLFDATATDLGIRLLAPDRPGYGRSSPWPARSLRDAGTVVEALLDDVGVSSAGLVAFSGGAPHALATAATRPTRVTRVDVVAGATPPTYSEATPTVQRLLAGLATTTPFVLRGLLRGEAWLADRLDPSFVVAHYTAGTRDVSDAVAEPVKADFVEAFARHRCGVVTDLRNTARDWNLQFDDLDPTIGLWHGTRDTNVPLEDARRFESQLPTARLRVFDGADHLETLVRGVPQALERHRR